MDPNPYAPPSTYRNAYCSFCRRSYVDTGPLVEGPEGVFICHKCAVTAINIIEEEARKRGLTPEDARFYRR